MMRLPKLYEDAATICAIVASRGGDVFIAADAIGARIDAVDIASTCFERVPLVYVYGRAGRVRVRVSLEWAEAEAWIRSGWREPGDERDFS